LVEVCYHPVTLQFSAFSHNVARSSQQWACSLIANRIMYLTDASWHRLA
jgi:hypothetical protein